jgi:hypothetical protein
MHLFEGVCFGRRRPKIVRSLISAEAGLHVHKLVGGKNLWRVITAKINV